MNLNEMTLDEILAADRQRYEEQWARYRDAHEASRPKGVRLLRSAFANIRLWHPRREWPHRMIRAIVAWVRTRGQGYPVGF